MFHRIKLFGVVILLILLTVVMSYPLIFRSNSVIPGSFSTDEPYAVLWDHWRVKYSLINFQSLSFTNLIAYPFGINLNSTQTGIIWNLWQLVNLLLAVVFGVPLSYNLQIIINFFLCAFIVYLLVFYLTGNRMSAVFSGIVFGFCPYQFVRSWQHLGATYNQWLALTFLALFSLKEKPNRKTGIFLLISFILLFSFDYYLAYFTLIGLAFFLLYVFLNYWKIKLKRENFSLIKADIVYLRRVFFTLILTFILLLPQHYSLIKKWLTPSSLAPSAWNPYLRPFEDLFSQSAKPLSYFLPPIFHPLLGKITEAFLGSPLYGESVTEHTLYLGWIPLILAFVAIKRQRRRRKEINKIGTVPFGDSPYFREDFYIGFFILLAIVAWFFSQPPWWQFGPLRIYLPSFFMYKLLPMFRAYCRFGIVIMLAVAVLAGFGLKFILERFKSNKAKIAITALACSLVLFEFWNWPPYKVIDVSKVPAVYYWLKEQPTDTIIAEYPLDADSPNEMYKFYQTKHEKKIINGTLPGTSAHEFAQTIIQLSSSKTAKILKSMGVRYVLVHHDVYLATGLSLDNEELARIPQNLGLKFIRSFSPQECPQKDIMCTQATGPIDVYEVIAKPLGLVEKNR